MSLELIAGGLGLASGGVAGSVWTIASARLASNEFWRRVREVLLLLLSSDGEEQFFRQYMSILPMLFKYLARQLVILLLAFAPVVICYLALTAFGPKFEPRRITHVELAPPQTLTVDIAGQKFRLDATQNKIPNSVDLDEPATLHSATDGQFRCETLMCKQAYSPDRTQRFILSLFGFQILKPESLDEAVEVPGFLLQPSSGDDNLLWPYLNDWEFAFLVTVSLASVVSALISKVSRR